MIIDPPSVFAPLAEWQSFLVELEGITTDDDDAKALIAEYTDMAKERIAQG